MHRDPSRREKREQKLVYSAEHGIFEIELMLFKSEAKNLRKKGFYVRRHGDNVKDSLLSTVAFRNPFKSGIPPIVFSYINGEINTFPKTDNWAQELYVIAARANHEKKLAKKNNE